MTRALLPPAGRLATAFLAAAVLSVALAGPALAQTAPTTTTTTTTTAPAAPTTTTAAPVTTTTTTAATSTTTSTTAPGPTTTVVNPAILKGLLQSLNADLAQISAVAAFASAKAAAAALVAAGTTAANAAPTTDDPELLWAASGQLAAGRARESAEHDLSLSRRRLNELAVSFYVHADAKVRAAPNDSRYGTALDPTVILNMLFRQERHDFDKARKNLSDAMKSQAAAKDHADHLVAARVAAIQKAAREAAAAEAAALAAAAVAAAATTTLPGGPTVAGSPTPKPGGGPSILGPPALTANELAAWYGSTGHQPSLTVPLATLTALYQSNGVTYGVRNDIAFAQSVIETGYFGFPGGGQVHTADNNFAGIGACDSCSSGRGFPDAGAGVAAQLQLLHNYANPVPLPGPLGLAVGPTGCCPTWMSLTGVWATATTYGVSILTLYKHMLEWVLPRRTSGAGL